MRKVKTIKLKQLIEKLQSIYIDRGNLDVVLSRDEEGNGFGTLDPDEFDALAISVERDGKLLVLWPCVEYLDLDDIDTDDEGDEPKHQEDVLEDESLANTSFDDRGDYYG